MVIVAKISGGAGQQQGEVEDARPVGHGGAAAVTHKYGPAFGGELFAGGCVTGKSGVFAGDDKALGRLPEVSAGLAIMGAFS
ncbi:hypothetical protein D3C84_812050 [compost metagenome]